MKKYFSITGIALITILAFSMCTKSEKNPMACCSVPTTATIGQTVSFSSSCSMDATDYKWMFGDGDSSMMANPTHIYTAASTYTISFMAMKGSKMDQLTKTITVN